MKNIRPPAHTDEHILGCRKVRSWRRLTTSQGPRILRQGAPNQAELGFLVNPVLCLPAPPAPQMEEKGNLVAVSLPLTHTLYAYTLILDSVGRGFSQKLGGSQKGLAGEGDTELGI